MTDTQPNAATETTAPHRRYLCRHIHTRGTRCGSPALRGRDFCYYHDRTRREVPSAGRIGCFPMPRVDDRASIQLAIQEVLTRLAGGDIDLKRGSILLYGLQIASSNLRDPKPAHTQAHTHTHAAYTADQSAASPTLNPLLDELVEEVIPHPHHGDIAPITELPTQPPSALSNNPAIPSEAPTTPSNNPVIPSESASKNAVILSEARSAQSKDPDEPQTHPNRQPLSATNPTTHHPDQTDEPTASPRTHSAADQQPTQPQPGQIPH